MRRHEDWVRLQCLSHYFNMTSRCIAGVLPRGAGRHTLLLPLLRERVWDDDGVSRSKNSRTLTWFSGLWARLVILFNSLHTSGLVPQWLPNWLISFYGISTYLDLSYVERSGNCVHCSFMYFPTPPHEQDATQSQFLSGVLQVWIQFSFF